MNHLGDTNKMVSETPISDSTPHNVADLGMQIRRIERKLNAANAEVDRLTAKVAQLYKGAEEQNDRIKRLEEAGDEMRIFIVIRGYLPECANNWYKAKEYNL